MQGRKRAKYAIGILQQQPLFLVKNIIVLLLVIIGGTTFLYVGSATLKWSHNILPKLTSYETVATNGADRWEEDSRTTAPTFDFATPPTQEVSISSLFENSYHHFAGATSLGAPLTVAFPTNQGWMQFFISGALLLPKVQHDHVSVRENTLDELLDSGIRDSTTGIVRLPLLQTLLTMGSEVPIGGTNSTLTYVDLRKATNPNRMLPSLSAHITAPTAIGNQSIFIKGGTRGDKDVGHLVPQLLWNYINRPDISPDGWETDFGDPLTDPLAFTLTKDGSIHHMLVQAFWHDGLILDQDTRDSAGQPLIQRLDTGVAYLRTIGPPPIALSTSQITWTQSDTSILNLANTGDTIAHVAQHFPLTLLGDTSWHQGMLWYHVQWAALKHLRDGWVPASSITFSAPTGNGPASASLDALSSELGPYLANLGSNVSAVVYDVARQQYFTYQPDLPLMMASSMKVPIMLTFLDMTEQQGREPNDQEMNLLTTMIENSDNDSASALYYGSIGGATGITNYLQKIGVTGLSPDPDAWGYSLVTSMTMVNLLARLYTGTILTQQDRNLALSLMENIETDQQVGVGDTAPQGATVAMKDGWVPDPNGLWVMNSSGIVSLGQQTYIIAVYTQGLSSLDAGQAITRHICSAIASLLT